MILIKIGRVISTQENLYILQCQGYNTLYQKLPALRFQCLHSYNLPLWQDHGYVIIYI